MGRVGRVFGTPRCCVGKTGQCGGCGHHGGHVDGFRPCSNTTCATTHDPGPLAHEEWPGRRGRRTGASGCRVCRCSQHEQQKGRGPFPDSIPSTHVPVGFSFLRYFGLSGLFPHSVACVHGPGCPRVYVTDCGANSAPTRRLHTARANIPSSANSSTPSCSNFVLLLLLLVCVRYWWGIYVSVCVCACLM